MKDVYQNTSVMRYMGNRSIQKVSPRDYPTFLNWSDARGIRMPNKELLSDLGYMADGRVVGWLYLTNSGIAMIEYILSDPNTVPSLRRASLKKLLGFLIDTALALGYTHIFGLSKHPNMIELCKEYGFEESKDYSLLVLTDEGDYEQDDE